MRISELSRQSGVPVATIKFYLREQLLPPGRATSRNQAQYGDQHLRRLRLIRAFTTIGQLELSSVRSLLQAVDDTALPLSGLLTEASRALFRECPAPAGDEVPGVVDDVDRLLQLIGWEVGQQAPGRDKLARIVATMRQLGCTAPIEVFAPYAAAAEKLAGDELDMLSDGDRGAAAARALLLYEAFASIRQLAQEHLIATRL